MEDKDYFDVQFKLLFEAQKELKDKFLEVECHNKIVSEELVDIVNAVEGNKRTGITGVNERIKNLENRFENVESFISEIKKMITGVSWIVKFLVAAGGFLLFFSEVIKNWLESKGFIK